MMIFFITIAIVLLGMTGLGIGYLLQGRCLRGRCGGEGIIGPDGAPMLCDHCPNRDQHEDMVEAS